MPWAWQAASKPAMNSVPPSTWIARTGKGKRASTSARKAVAVSAVA